MAWKFNPFTGTLDIVGSGAGSTFDVNTILTYNFFLLMDENGNVLVGV